MIRQNQSVAASRRAAGAVRRPAPLAVLLALLLALSSAVLHPVMAADGDHDEDGVPDAIDIDDDNDTIADDNEGDADTDGDGLPDRLDSDSDNDGISDMIEAVRPLSTLLVLDGSGNAVEAFDGLMDSNVQVGENGLADAAETSPDSGLGATGYYDTDGDGVRDQIDLDSDNDGITDLLEFGCASDRRVTQDSDNNGRIDRLLDDDKDGIDDLINVSVCGGYNQDFDEDFDFRDIDSDNDGLTDAREAFDDDVDGDGQIDRFRDTNGDGLDDAYATDPRKPRDTDGDGLADYVDPDSNNDGVVDAQEAGGSGETPPTVNQPVPGDSQPDASDDAGDTPAAQRPEPAPEDGVAVDPDTSEPVNGPIRTGREGGAGCSVLAGTDGSPAQALDLALLAAMAMLILMLRGWRAGVSRRRAAIQPARLQATKSRKPAL